MKKELDICILSDLHLGTMGSKPIELLKYLKNIRPGLLIFSGVFINPDQFEKKYFSRKTLMIIHQIMEMALSGTKVVMITGSGKKGLKRFSGVNIGNIHLRKEMLLKLSGKEYLVCNYPPEIDKHTRRKKVQWINLHRLLTSINQSFFLKFGNKDKNTQPSKKRSDFLIKYAHSKGVSGLISCDLSTHGLSEVVLPQNTLELFNPGSWSLSLTALEYSGGHWELYTYNDLDYGLFNPKLTIKKEAQKELDEIFIVRKPIGGNF